MNRTEMHDATTEPYGWTSPEVPRSQLPLYQHLETLVGSAGGRTVLDLGCGNGYFCGRLLDRGLDVVGLDNDRKGIEIAERAYPKARFVRAPLADALGALGGERFDVVVCSEVVEHLYQPTQLTDVAREVLAPEGVLVVSTPYHGYLKNLALSVASAWDRHHSPLHDGGHIKFWSKATLTTLLENAGFEVVRFEGVGRAPFLWKSMILVARKSGTQASHSS